MSVMVFCDLLWTSRCYNVVQSATSINTAIFCGIGDNYGIYSRTVESQCISNLFLVIFTPLHSH